MTITARNRRLFIIASLLVVLALSQVAYAAPNRVPQDPPWVIVDRQRTETTNYVPPVNGPFTAPNRVPGEPPWVRDRQQYETSYIYIPSVNGWLIAPVTSTIPQWAKDRQQYEINYVYIPSVNGWLPTISPIQRLQQNESHMLVP